MAKKFQTRRHHRAPRARSFRLPPRFSIGILGTLLVASFAGYLVQVNAASSKGFQIRTLQEKISDLKQQVDKTELRVAQEQSVASVEQKVREMGMVPTDEVQYVSSGASVVAQR